MADKPEPTPALRERVTRALPPIPPPPLQYGKSGRLRNPSPLKGLQKKERRRVMLGVLEHAAVHGNTNAAAKVLDHERWLQEMEDGRAPTRGSERGPTSITVIDDVGADHQAERAPPTGESGEAELGED